MEGSRVVSKLLIRFDGENRTPCFDSRLSSLESLCPEGVFKSLCGNTDNEPAADAETAGKR